MFEILDSEISTVPLPAAYYFTSAMRRKSDENRRESEGKVKNMLWQEYEAVSLFSANEIERLIPFGDLLFCCVGKNIYLKNKFIKYSIRR